VTPIARRLIRQSVRTLRRDFALIEVGDGEGGPPTRSIVGCFTDPFLKTYVAGPEEGTDGFSLASDPLRPLYTQRSLATPGAPGDVGASSTQKRPIQAAPRQNQERCWLRAQPWSRLSCS
jgi:hypothetical protein